MGADGSSVPLKEVATSDTLLLRTPPAADDAAARKTLAALAKASVHCIVPAAALHETPLPGAVPLVACEDLEQKLLLRAGETAALGDSGRLVVSLRGDESDEQLATLCAREAEVDMLLVQPPAGVSRLHASRRLFTTLKQRGVETLSAYLARSRMGLNLILGMPRFCLFLLLRSGK